MSDDQPHQLEPQALDLSTHEVGTAHRDATQTPLEAFTETFINERNAAVTRIVVIGVLLVILAGLFSLLNPSDRIATGHVAAPPHDPLQDAATQTPFPKVSLKAKAAYVYDIRSQKALFTKNATAQLPLASITKLMTVYVATELFHNEGLLALDNHELSSDNISPMPSTQWIPNDVFTYTLMQSSNLGASTIASAAGAIAPTSENHSAARDIFIERMNATALRLDLEQTYFLNETGLDESTETGGGYGSARDAALLIAALARDHMETLEQTRLPAKEFEATDHSKMVAINTNTIVGEIPGLIGSKTGYTRLAGGNLAIVFDAGLGRPIAIAVLGSTEEGRFDDTKALVDATLTYLSANHTAL